VGQWADMAGLQDYFTRLMGASFVIGLQLAMPVVVMSLLLYLGAGILSRLMPNIQIFSIIMPPQILLSIFVWMTVFTAIILQYTQFFSDTYEHFMDLQE
jgi:flagellar biosynthetic protein FliR